MANESIFLTVWTQQRHPAASDVAVAQPLTLLTARVRQIEVLVVGRHAEAVTLGDLLKLDVDIMSALLTQF